MDCIKQHRGWVWISAACVGVGTVYFVWRKYRKRTKPFVKRICGVDYPKDIVILHYPDFTSTTVPSIGHFCMKLQTYLNATKIPYKLCLDSKQGKSPKGKLPWIEYNDVTMGDSQLIINYLNNEFNVNLNNSLDTYQRAMSWAIQKWLEEFTYWLNVHTRWVIFSDELLTSNVLAPTLRNKLIHPMIKHFSKTMTHTVGVGRHTDEEIGEMMQFDLRQLSTILGNKKYLMGDVLTELDCAAFGILSQIRLMTPDKCPGKQLLLHNDELKNVRDYIDRIKDEYWKDWDNLLLKE